MNRIIRLPFALLLLAVAACSGQKEPATQGMARVEATLAAVREDARRHASAELDAVEQRLAALRTEFEKQNYGAVAKALPELDQQLAALQETTAQRRREAEEADARARQAWSGLAAEIPRHIDTLQKRLDLLVRQRKVARGASAESLLLDNVRNIWADADNLFRVGQSQQAVTRAEEARAKARELAEQLGATLDP